MNITQFKKLKVGDTVQLKGSIKKRDMYAIVVETFVDKIPTATGVMVEVMPGEIKKYSYKSLRYIEDLRKEFMI